ncbi:MAG: hypothetical protein F4213_03295 [Boseongicola sp. SB0677_bin_26]|nr:hypothetical protein [Boseongicola sp. SB0665_bin_10]MYG25040.1 hypothetical protein [Boseongicola sp. SB0677_bin_26]
MSDSDQSEFPDNDEASVRPSIVSEHEKVANQPPDIPGRPKDWRDQIKADLAAQPEAGGTLYGVRSDGAYIARTREGDRVSDPVVVGPDLAGVIGNVRIRVLSGWCPAF